MTGNLLAYHLKSPRVPLVVCVPQFENHWIRVRDWWKKLKNHESNLFRPKMRGNVKKNNPVNIRFVAKTLDIKSFSVNIISDVMLKYQKWQHWYQWSQTSGAVSRSPLPNCTFVASSRVTCGGNALFFRWLPSLCSVLPTLRFSREFGLAFFVELQLFLNTCGLFAFGLVFIEICLFFCRFLFCRLLFFKCYGTFAVQFTAKGTLGVFLWKFSHFGLVFSDLPPWFFICFSCWFFVLLNFPANTFCASFSVKLPILFFKLTCLFLQNNLASLVVLHHEHMKLFKPLTPHVIAWSVRRGFNQSIRRTRAENEIAVFS